MLKGEAELSRASGVDVQGLLKKRELVRGQMELGWSFGYDGHKEGLTRGIAGGPKSTVG